MGSNVLWLIVEDPPHPSKRHGTRRYCRFALSTDETLKLYGLAEHLSKGWPLKSQHCNFLGQDRMAGNMDALRLSTRRQWYLLVLMALTCTATIAFTHARALSSTRGGFHPMIGGTAAAAVGGEQRHTSVTSRASVFLTRIPPRGGGSSRLKPPAATRIPSTSDSISTSSSTSGEAAFDGDIVSGSSSSIQSFVEDPSKVRSDNKRQLGI